MDIYASDNRLYELTKALTQVMPANEITCFDNTNYLSTRPHPLLRGETGIAAFGFCAGFSWFWYMERFYFIFLQLLKLWVSLERVFLPVFPPDTNRTEEKPVPYRGSGATRSQRGNLHKTSWLLASA